MNNTTRRHPRTLQEAFGPYCDSRIAEIKPQRLQPWGCDQQGRYLTRANARYDHWAHQEWQDTIVAARKPPRAPRKHSDNPLTLGDLLLVVWLVGAIAAFVSLGPWL